MATQFSEAFIASVWPLSNIKFGTQLRKSGDTVVWKITSDQGEYVCKATYSWKSKEQAAKDLFVFDFLTERKFASIPRIIKTKTGKTGM